MLCCAASPSADCQCGIKGAANRIVNGEAAESNEYPWQVIVHGGGFCGGTVVNKRFVVTAAHCTHEKDAGQMFVMVGEHDMSQARRCSRIPRS